MKKSLVLVALLLTSILLIGCQSSDDVGEKVENPDTQNRVVDQKSPETEEETKTEEAKTDENKVFMPDFELQNMNGDTVKLSDLQGKIVFINFWAEWCHFCKEEMPDIQKMYEEFELTRDDFVILAVNVKDSKDTVEKYLTSGNYSFQTLLDTDGSVASKYYIQSFPTTYMLDTDGSAIGRQIGLLKEEPMREAIEKALANKDAREKTSTEEAVTEETDENKKQ